jgi:hypothetical protein
MYGSNFFHSSGDRSSDVSTLTVLPPSENTQAFMPLGSEEAGGGGSGLAEETALRHGIRGLLVK